MGIMSPRSENVEGDRPTTYGPFGTRISSEEIEHAVNTVFNISVDKPVTTQNDTYNELDEDNMKPDKEKGYLINKNYQVHQIPERDDPVNHPAHYKAYSGFEVIDLTEQMNFNRGNAVKYICRAGLKSKETEIQDLEKAAWYIHREINRLKGVSESV